MLTYDTHDVGFFDRNAIYSERKSGVAGNPGNKAIFHSVYMHTE